MDDADITQRNLEFLERANRHRSHRHEVTEKPNGKCLYCGEPVEENRRWCNDECRDDWLVENE